jgi:hypothetical protein
MVVDAVAALVSTDDDTMAALTLGLVTKDTDEDAVDATDEDDVEATDTGKADGDNVTGAATTAEFTGTMVVQK